MDQRDWPMPRVNGPKEWQRDRVIPTDRDQPGRPVEELRRCDLDLRDGFPNVERGAGDVACVGDLAPNPRFHVEPRMVRPKELRTRADCARTKARSTPVGDARVEWDPDDPDVRSRDVIEPR